MTTTGYRAEIVEFGQLDGPTEFTLSVREVGGAEVADSLYRCERTSSQWELAPLAGSSPRHGLVALRLAWRSGETGLRVGDVLLQTEDDRLVSIWDPPGAQEVPATPSSQQPSSRLGSAGSVSE